MFVSVRVLNCFEAKMHFAAVHYAYMVLFVIISYSLLIIKFAVLETSDN